MSIVILFLISYNFLASNYQSLLDDFCVINVPIDLYRLLSSDENILNLVHVFYPANQHSLLIVEVTSIVEDNDSI